MSEFHLLLGSMESAAVEPSDFDRWVDVVEQKLGHDLDGSQACDGYSLDYAVDAYRDGITCDQYVAQVLEAKKTAGGAL